MTPKIFIAASLALLSACASVAETASGPPTMTLDGDVLTGEGAALLQEEYASAQFILIGEDHGFADPAEIALAIAKETRVYGFDHHVIETGPLTRDRLTGILETGGPSDLAAVLAGRPIAMPFVNMQQDAELADYFVDAAEGATDALWGIDQEFIGAPLLHLETLESLATTSEQAALARTWIEKDQAAFSSRNMSGLMMMSASAEDFAGLRAEFAGNADATMIIDALEESAKIYALYFTGANYASNAERIDLIRQQFLSDYRASGSEAPRALFKMGLYHLGNGTTPVNTVDVGSLVDGIAATNNLDALRIAVLPLEGRQTALNPSAQEVFSVVDQCSDEVAALLAAAAISESEIPQDGYAVIALKDVRTRLDEKGIAALSVQNRFLVLGFDYLVTTRGARPATPLAN